MWDPYRVALSPDAKPGRYEIVAGLYYWEDGQRVEITGGNADQEHALVPLGSIQIDSTAQEQSDDS